MRVSVDSIFRKSVITGACLFSVVAGFAQTVPFKYRSLDASYLTSTATSADAMSRSATNGYDLSAALPKGYVKDGTVDYTAYIQKALDNNRNVIFPPFPLLVNEKGLDVSSNSNITFQNGSKLLLSPTSKGTYEILRLDNVQNVNIYNATIVGDRKKHTGSDGQWGMGIAIRSSKNVKLVKPVVSECWGDGIYLGQLPKGGTNQSISIYNAFLDFNRRNGISIVSVNGLKLIQPVISNTYGNPPMCGIDIEPNNNSNIIDNIEMDRPVTFNSAQHGIVISLSRLIGSNDKDVNISIKDHVDDGSAVGFAMGGLKPSYSFSPLKGNIEVVNPTWKNNRERPFRSYNPNGYAPTLTFRKVNILSADRSGRATQNQAGFLQMQKTVSAQKKILIEQ